VYLKELEIFGFKSFPEKTSLKFESGVTAVVGPNGCGKSNVFDAVKWALGEQSPKSLRGTKMEDIIFNGTQNQAPLNYAEVALIFDNEDKYLPIDYKEVAVSRRLYRSGESQYFINKSPVRLKDVQELFMGTGIGESTYSFVEQGKIEIFLSYKPEDKRLIFDEASGIVKYKERKKEALRRLNDAEENLLRLEDILSEVRRQIRYLERQVDKAQKYKQVKEKLLEVEKKVAAIQFKKLEGKINSLLDELNAFKSQEENKTGQLRQVSGSQEEMVESEKQLREKLERTNTIIVSLQAQMESFNTHIGVNRQRVSELEERNVNLEASKLQNSQRLEFQDKRNQEEGMRIEAIGEEIKSLSEDIEKISLEKNQLQQRIEEAKQGGGREKEKILDLENKKSQTHNTLIEIQARSSSLINRKKRLLLDRGRLESLVVENKEKFDVTSGRFSKAKEELSDSESKRQGLANREKEITLDSENFRSKTVEKEKELLELNTTYEFLKDLRIKYETFSVQRKVTIIFDEEPKDINKMVASLQGAEFVKEGGRYKAQIEAKVVSFKEKELEERMDVVKKEIDDAKNRFQQLHNEKEELVKLLSAENVLLEEKKRTLQEEMQERDSLAKENLRLEEEVGLLKEEEKNVAEEIAEATSQHDRVNNELSFHEQDLDSAKQSLSGSQSVTSKSSERINEIEITTTRGLTQIEALAKEKQTLTLNITVFEEEVKNIQDSLQQIAQENEENLRRSLSFTQQIEELELKFKQGESKINEQTEVRKSTEEESAKLVQIIEDTKKSIQVLENENQKIKTDAYNKKLEIQSLEYEKEKIIDYLKQVYEIEFNPTQQEEALESIEMLTEEKEKLQKKVKSLGEVNLVAIEEFEELKGRDDFMESQKQDLVTSKENLKKAIQKINRTSREIFLEVFRKIEVEFKKNFKFLFNGGRANLILVDENNILESGVEIEVQPPGKKLQNVSLLSGGEKALTAIALIFAIFQVRPSPLCVLDEIDAPLDEANVDRFNHLLKEFAASSQFIVITHNKKTMSSADVLYGVTMQERGISKLVSVKFADETTPAKVNS